MENQELTKAQAEYQAACETYEKKTNVPTARMNPAQKKAHLQGCIDLLNKKRECKSAVDAILKSKKSFATEDTRRRQGYGGQAESTEVKKILTTD